jgi:hypothetical protein
MERLRKGKALSKAFRRAGPVVIGADLLQIMGVGKKEE